MSLVGVPEGFSMKAVGIESDDPRSMVIPIDQDITKELRVQVFAPPQADLISLSQSASTSETLKRVKPSW